METTFVAPLGPGDRRRQIQEVRRGRVVHFAVQYETLINGKWHAVVRYDTVHGFAHKDILHPDGRRHKEELGVLDYNEALTFAQEDITANWRMYRRRYINDLNRDK